MCVFFFIGEFHLWNFLEFVAKELYSLETDIFRTFLFLVKLDFFQWGFVNMSNQAM